MVLLVRRGRRPLNAACALTTVAALSATAGARAASLQTWTLSSR